MVSFLLSDLPLLALLFLFVLFPFSSFIFFFLFISPLSLFFVCGFADTVRVEVLACPDRAERPVRPLPTPGRVPLRPPVHQNGFGGLIYIGSIGGVEPLQRIGKATVDVLEVLLGWVTSSWDGDAERRGPRRRMYRLTPEEAVEARRVVARAAPASRWVPRTAQ